MQILKNILKEIDTIFVLKNEGMTLLCIILDRMI